jgi:glyoxylase-like metal-dependent hydrolase (beta-lactamase superfamily II)
VTRIRHLNCLTFRMGYAEVSHCLLVETSDGLALVDSGLGLRDYSHPTWRLRVFAKVDRVLGDPDETAIRQVVKLGCSPRDVRHIVLTHLHLDHAGGMADFPWAKVHVWEMERSASLRRRPFDLLAWLGYEPAQWAHGPNWVCHTIGAERWFDLPGMPVLGGKTPEILLIPLPGHTPGHCGAAVRDEQGWLLHCGDCFIRTIQLDPLKPANPRSRRFWWPKRALRSANSRELVRGLLRRHGSEVCAFGAHDPIALAGFRKNSPML